MTMLLKDANFSIGFTGTRLGITEEQKKSIGGLILGMAVTPDEFHHGDCIGADSDAHDIVRALSKKIKIIIHPPKKEGLRAFKKGDETRQPLGYYERDRNIVKNANMVIAAVKEKDVSVPGNGGTWYTINYALSHYMPVKIILPNGEVKHVEMPL